MFKKLFASLTVLAIALTAVAAPALAASPDVQIWDSPVQRGVSELAFEIEQDGDAQQVFVGPGRRGIADVALTVKDNRVYAGPVTRLPNVLFTAKGNQLWSGRNTWGLQNVLFTLSDDNRVYAGPSTHDLGSALYTIRGNHVYEGPTVQQNRIVFTADVNLESQDAMTKLLLPILIEGRF